MKSFLLVFMWLFFIPNITIGQDHYLLDDFIAYKEQNRVILNWTVKRGSSCIGIGILRSTNKVDYDIIGEIKGVCGSNEKAQSYSFIDESPEDNADNYYVLEMGFSGKTDPPLRVQFTDVTKLGYKVVPQPFVNNCRIYFRNDDFEPHNLNIYNLSGVLMDTFTSNVDVFEVTFLRKDGTDINNSNNYLEVNIFLFEIVNEKGAVVTKGKLLRS